MFFLFNLNLFIYLFIFCCCIRAFPVDCLKFKLKFGLRPYFFKTLISDSLFSTLFHLNIHYLFIFYYFLNSQNIFFFHFPPPLPLFRCISPPSIFSFLFPPTPTYHFFSLSFFFSPTATSATSSTETQQLQQKKTQQIYKLSQQYYRK